MSDTTGYNSGVTRDAAADLLAIAVELERAGEAGYRIRAFRRAAQTVAGTDPAELADRAAQGTLAKLPGLGEVTARCVAESLAGEEPVYLRRPASPSPAASPHSAWSSNWPRSNASTPVTATASACCPASRSTSSTTGRWTRPTSCSAASTSWWPACTASCARRPR